MQILTSLELSQLLSDSNNSNNGTIVKVIDVRDEDRRGGHIATSLHMPSQSFSPTKLLQHVSETNTNTNGKDVLLVFHCMMSQVRGPKCARMTNEYLISQQGHQRYRVAVLEGGFMQWQQLYGQNQQLTNDYDINGWQQGFYY